MSEIFKQRILIVGASGGIGQAFTQMYMQDASFYVITASRKMPAQAGHFHVAFDFEDDTSLEHLSKMIEGPLDVILFATGFLHDNQSGPEKTYRTLNRQMMEKSFLRNTIGPMLLCKYLIPRLDRGRVCKIVFLGARVGSISDNRLGGWYSYRSSKAALHMMVKNISIELGRTHKKVITIALHPGTVDTDLSKPFQKNVAAEKLFSPALSVEKMRVVIDALSSDDSGYIFDWAGKKIEP